MTVAFEHLNHNSYQHHHHHNITQPLFEEVTALHRLYLPPRHLKDLEAGAREQLDRQLLKYSRELSGVPLVYGKLDVHVNDSAPIHYDNPCIHLQVRVIWTVFSPRLGARLKGKVNMTSHGHLGLLVLSYFNVTIHSNQMAAALDWNETEQIWYRKNSSNESVNIGDEIEFEVIDLQHKGHVMTIIGSLDKLLHNNTIEQVNNSSSGMMKKKRSAFINQESPKTRKKKLRKHE